MRRTIRRNAPWIILLAAALVWGATGCSGSDEESDRCAGPRLLPNRSPVVFGEAFPPPDDEQERNPGVREHIPVAETILIESKCERTLEIEQACLVGEKDDDGESDAEQFTTTGPNPPSVEFDDESAFRLTYERSTPNDGNDVDNAAAVFQTNAKNFPTLVIPVCARVVSEGSDRGYDIECTSPVQAPPEGQKKEGLCN